MSRTLDEAIHHWLDKRAAAQSQEELADRAIGQDDSIFAAVAHGILAVSYRIGELSVLMAQALSAIKGLDTEEIIIRRRTRRETKPFR